MHLKSNRSLTFLFLFCLLATLPGAPLAAQTINTWKGPEYGKWSVPENWSLGHPPQAGEKALIPGWSYVDIVENLVIEFPVEIEANAYVTIIRSPVDLARVDLENEIVNKGTLDCYFGDLYIYSGAKLVNSGLLENSETINNSGVIANTGEINNRFIFRNSGTIENSGQTNNEENFYNTGVFRNNGRFRTGFYNEEAVLENNGDFINGAGSWFKNCGIFKGNALTNLAGASVNPGGDQNNNGIDDTCEDKDGDGVPYAQDCDDTDPNIRRPSAWYADTDRDGYGDPGSTANACAQPAGYVSNDDDCDDTSDAVYPGAPEFCDGLDNDCDGTVDETSLALTLDPSCTTVFYGYTGAYACTTLSAQASGGEGPYQYEWSHDPSTSTGQAGFCADGPGNVTVTVTVTDQYGCSQSANIEVHIVDLRCGKNNDLVQVCHRAPGNQTQYASLCIEAADVADHLAHGDRLGECGLDDPCGGSGPFQLAVPSFQNNPPVATGDLEIFPNPAHDAFWISLKTYAGRPGTLIMVNPLGQIVYEQHFDALPKAPQRVNPGGLETGVYLATLRIDGLPLLTRRLLIRRR